MSDEQITPKRRGRPRKIQPQHETPTIKEGARWNIPEKQFDGPDPGGELTEPEVEAITKRHNEAMQNKLIGIRPSDVVGVDAHFEIKPEPELAQDSAIQIKEGPNRGVICQVGQVEGDTVRCYQQLINGEKTFLSTKMGEFIVLCPRRSGMVARKWEKKETAPQWHDNKTHVPEGNQ